ncbi:MAG: DUF3365 domain-containing protein [Planctomycetota bacterium]|nr:MAG: DUF3365 domain-containing protein [Planctomycetota bacterium]
MKRALPLALSLSALVLLSACPRSRTGAPPAASRSVGDAPTQPAGGGGAEGGRGSLAGGGAAPSGDWRERARAVARALGGRLKARLKQAIDAGGFARGIEECKLAAPEVAAAVGREEGARVGRTSFRLRNPQNAPPEWAADAVRRQVSEPLFLDAPGAPRRALLPIRLEPLCVACHGPADGLAPEVRAALDERYPEDQATGFSPGDLRGYFWVELPRVD